MTAVFSSYFVGREIARTTPQGRAGARAMARELRTIRRRQTSVSPFRTRFPTPTSTVMPLLTGAMPDVATRTVAERCGRHLPAARRNVSALTITYLHNDV